MSSLSRTVTGLSVRLRRWSSPGPLLIFLFIAFAPAASAEPLEGRLLLPDGKPAAGSHVSIPGVPGSARADGQGRFTLAERGEFPLTLVVIGSRGEIFPPVTLDAVPDGLLEIQLEPGLREEVTVTSGVAPNIEAPPAAATSVIGHEDLEERRPAHLVEALTRTPGVDVRGEGPAAVPVIRGLAGGRTLILLDDARVSTERRAGPSATFLDPFSLGSIEVSRGPGSVAYGSDALGGVIHARPRDPVPGDPALLYEATGSFGGRSWSSAGVEFTHDVPGGAFLAMIHARQGDDAEDGAGNPIPNSGFEDRGGSLRFVSPTEKGMFRVGLSIADAFDTGAPAADADVTRTYYPEENSRRLTLSWDGSAGRLLNLLQVRMALGSSGVITNRERLPRSAATRQISSASVDADDVSFRVAGTHLTAPGRLHGGIDLVRRYNLKAAGFVQQFDLSDAATTRTDEISIEDANKNDLGAFLIYDWNVAPRVVLSGGGRVDFLEIQNRGGFFGTQSRSDTALSGYASIAATPFSSMTATLQVSSGYRDPTLSDRYFRGVSGRGFVVGNPDLEPERSLQLDGGLRWTRGSRSVALLGYHYNIRDLVERYREGADFHFRNRGEAEVKGIELELATPLPYGFSMQASGTLARGEALDDAAPLDDIAAPNAQFALRWSSMRASAFLHGSIFGEDDRPGPVETDRPGYATLDLGLGWRFSEKFELRVHGRNIGNRLYAGSADANASMAPGRSVSIGITGKL